MVDRSAFDTALAEQVVAEKELTRFDDRISTRRRRLPMVEVENYWFTGPDGPISLVELFGDHYLLLVQNVMFGPDWEEGCPSWHLGGRQPGAEHGPGRGGRHRFRDDLPGADREAPGLAGRAGLETPLGVLWVSSGETSHHADWGATLTHESGYQGPVPGYSYYLLKDGKPFLTYMTGARGTEAILPTTHIMDRTC